jgi:hypothetical protein
MAKIDFSKVEEELSKTLHSMFVKNLLEGRPTVSAGAISFFRLDDGARPIPPDTVMEGIHELEEETKKENARQERRRAWLEELARQGIPPEEAPPFEEPEEIPEPPPAPLGVPNIPPPEKIPTLEAKPTKLITILKEHLSWLGKNKVPDIIKKLGTTEEELAKLKKKKNFSDAENARLATLVEKAQTLKAENSKARGLADDEALIEKERKKHLTKRFNINETWLPLQ